MCKLLIMTRIVDGEKAFKFMEAMAVPMSKMNTDGIGYTAVNPDGSIFAERWHNNYSFLDREGVMLPSIAKKLKKYENNLPFGALDTNYSSYGSGDLTKATSITMHTRYATTGTEFINTHPFIYNDVSLVHNGMIRNWEELKVNKISTCDSEAALQTYINQDVVNDINKTQDWANQLEGSYAFGVLAKDSSGKRILDVVKGSSYLYEIEIEGVGLVFTTDDSDAKSICNKLGLTITKKPSMLTYGTLLRFDALTGEKIGEFDIKSKHVETTRYWGGTYDYNRGWTPNRSSSSSVTTTQEAEVVMDEEMTSLYEKYPHLFKSKGVFQYAKVQPFLNDSMEDIVDRLRVFDKVFTRNTVFQYNNLSDSDKAIVKNYDLAYTFRSTRAMIASLHNAMLENAL